MTDNNNRLAVTIWDKKVKGAVLPLWNKVQLGFNGSRFDLMNLIKELKEIKDFINKDMNQKGYALRDVEVLVEFYPDFQKQVFEMKRFISENGDDEFVTPVQFVAGLDKIANTLVSDKTINITTKDALFLFGTASLLKNESLSSSEVRKLAKRNLDFYINPVEA